MPECPYCNKDCADRGLKNHVRLATGDGHGEQGGIPDDFDGPATGSNEAEPEPSDTDEPVEDDESEAEATDAATVTVEDVADTSPEESAESESEGSEYPFDPDDENAHELDGDEEIYVRVDGEIVEAKPDAGDYLLITESGPVLWDHETDNRYEVVTA